MHFRSVIAAVPFLGLATASPVATARSPAGCSKASFKGFEWTVQDFDFHASYIFSTPAHQNSWGYAFFDLVNPAEQTITHCEGSSSQLSDFFYGTVSYKCDDKTSFTFNRPTGELTLSQTWTCDDADPKYPTTFTAYGATNFTLTCEEATYQNPDWQIGEIYSSRTITCEKQDKTVKPSQLSAVA
ncbi:uncharacterized protein C8A04DRAFT_31231 [Dichotomopilus funicola]|uniref:AA1-like domain-containing protein n=1 Tax=Dichotomopilus funicola TaxID=1934379 RepID=A0AAN6UY44_9PEZI|nr:hypothetical protein C8A04DRAFT_31231 [Dichotomopilus funicola]